MSSWRIPWALPETPPPPPDTWPERIPATPSEVMTRAPWPWASVKPPADAPMLETAITVTAELPLPCSWNRKLPVSDVLELIVRTTPSMLTLTYGPAGSDSVSVVVPGPGDAGTVNCSLTAVGSVLTCSSNAPVPRVRPPGSATVTPVRCRSPATPCEVINSSPLPLAMVRNAGPPVGPSVSRLPRLSEGSFSKAISTAGLPLESVPCEIDRLPTSC